MFSQPPLGQVIHNLQRIVERFESQGDEDYTRLANQVLADVKAWKDGMAENNSYMYELGRKQGYRDKKTSSNQGQ